jgi:hypothetical protein
MRSDHLLGLKLWLWNRRIKRMGNRQFTPIHANENQASALSSAERDSRPFASIRGFREQELEKFLAYRNEGLLEFRLSEIPKADSGGPARMSGTPFILRLQQWLMDQFRLSEAEAWDYPVGLAKMRWAAHWESQGGMEVYNAHEAEFDQFVAEQRAAKKEKDPSSVASLLAEGGREEATCPA